MKCCFLSEPGNKLTFILGRTEHCFHSKFGGQIVLKDPVTARRIGGYSGGVTFSAFPLDNGNLFEVREGKEFERLCFFFVNF